MPSVERKTIKMAKDYQGTYISSGWGKAPLEISSKTTKKKLGVLGSKELEKSGL